MTDFWIAMTVPVGVLIFVLALLWRMHRRIKKAEPPQGWDKQHYD